MKKKINQKPRYNSGAVCGADKNMVLEIENSLKIVNKINGEI